MSFDGPYTSSLSSALTKPVQPKPVHSEHPATPPEVHTPADLTPPSNAHNIASLLGGLSAVARPVEQFAINLAHNLFRPETAGEQKAQAAIDVSSVADKRDAADKTMKDGNAQTTSRAMQLFNDVLDHQTPHGTQGQIDPKTGDAIITRKDSHGDVVSSERISYSTSGTSIETTSFGQVDGKSVETTSRQTAGLDGSFTTTEASYPGAPSKATPGTMDDKALMAERSPDVSYSSTTIGNQSSWIGQDGGKLTETTISSSGGKSSESQTQFWHEDDVKVDDKLKGAFHDGRADKSETRTFAFGDGGPTMTKSIATSQGSGADAVQATSTVQKQLTDPTETNACLAYHSADDAMLLASKNQNQLGFDGDSKSPKQWLLEKSTGNEYKSQTFIEGHTDASVITDKKVSGSTVTETQSGKWFDDKGKVNDVGGQASATYGADGRIDAYDSHQTDANGNQTDEMFTRTHRKDGESTDLKTWNLPAAGATSYYEQKENTKSTPNGPELLSASQLIDNGTDRAYAAQDGKQTSLSYDGQIVGKGSQLGTAAQALLGQAGGKLQGQLASFALNDGGLEAKAGDGGNPALDFIAQGLDQTRGAVAGATDQWSEERIKRYMNSSESIDSVTRDLTAVNAGGKFLAGTIGTAAAIPASVSAGTALANAIQSGDGWQIGQAGAGVAGAGIMSAQAGLNTVGGLALGISGGEKGLGALELATKLDKFGVAAGVLGGGVEAVSGIVNGNGADIAKGGVTAAGAIGGMLAADAAAGALAGSEVPLLGNAVGALVGLGVGGLTYGATQLIDAIGDDSHQIADRKI